MQAAASMAADAARGGSGESGARVEAAASSAFGGSSAAGAAAGLDEGLLSLSLPILVYI